MRKHNETGVFVTFEEHPSDIRRNVGTFGWDIGAFEKTTVSEMERLDQMFPAGTAL